MEFVEGLGHGEMMIHEIRRLDILKQENERLKEENKKLREELDSLKQEVKKVKEQVGAKKI